MTISSAIRKAGPFPGNGVTVAFPFAFKVFAATDVLAVLATTATGVETVQTLGANYTVALNADQAINPGGTVTMLVAPPVGTSFTIGSQVSNLQPTDLSNQGGFYPKVINDSFDRTVIQIQQLSELISRTLKAPISTPAGVNFALPAPTAYTLLGWDAAGTSLVNLPAVAGTSMVNLLNSPAFTGTPTAPTPAQFDNSTRVANMAAVQRALGSQRFLFGMTASTVLTAAHVGALVGCNAPGNYTLTLPSFAGLPSGSSISFIHSAGTSAPVTIVASGVDVIRSEGNVLPGIVLDLNQHVTLTTDGGTGWYVDNWNIYGATPPLFDNSTRLATTAALRLAGLSYSGITAITASRAITAADMGSIVYFAGPYTLTFPTPGSLGIPIGGSVTLYNTGTTVTAVAGAGASFDTRATPVNIAVGDFLTFTATNSNQWAQFGTGDLGKTVQFSSSISANGYQKLPSGLIVQWGTVATGAMSTYPAIPTTTSVTFPTAFPAACHVVSGNLSGGIGGGWLATTAEVLTPAGFTLRASSQVAIASQNFTYIAIGR